MKKKIKINSARSFFREFLPVLCTLRTELALTETIAFVGHFREKKYASSEKRRKMDIFQNAFSL